MAGAPANDNVKYRIGLISGFCMVALATVMYGVGGLLALTGIGEVATEIIDIGLSILFFFWFALAGVNYFEGRATAKLGIMGACTLIEMVPFINALVPALIIETVSIILITRKEDREKAQKKAEATAKKTAQAVQATEQMKAQFIMRRQQIAQQEEEVREAA